MPNLGRVPEIAVADPVDDESVTTEVGGELQAGKLTSIIAGMTAACQESQSSARRVSSPDIESLLSLQRSVGNAAVSAMLGSGRVPASIGQEKSGSQSHHGRVAVQRNVGSAAVRAATALGKRLLRSAGVRGSQVLYRAAARRALARLEKFGIDRAVALHIADHFIMIPEKVAHSVFEASLRNTKAVTALVTEALKRGASPILSRTESGALAWVFEADLGRRIGTAAGQGLTKLRIVVDLKGRLITAFPIKAFLPTMTAAGLRGIRVTLSGLFPIIALQGIYESEAEAAAQARKAFDERNEASWWEYLLPWGPSSTIGYEPSPSRVRERADAVAASIEDVLGNPLDREGRDAVLADVRSMWH